MANDRPPICNSVDLNRLARVAGLSAAALGVAALVGWALDISLLNGVLPGLATMKANSALAFAASGIALFLLRHPRPTAVRTRIGFGLAGFAFTIGFATGIEILANIDLGIDRLIFDDRTPSVAGAAPGRMSIATSIGFVLLGLALLMLDGRRLGFLRRTLSFALLALGGLALVAYLYGASSLYAVGVYQTMSFPTALAFFLLGIGIEAANPHRRIRSIFSGGIGGSVARRLLPSAVGIPVLIGWARLEGQRAGLYDTEFGLALFVLSTVVCFSAVVLWAASSLDRMDDDRRRIASSLQDSEARFRIMADAVPQIVWVAGGDGSTTYLNGRWNEFTGLTGASDEETARVIHPDDLARVRESWSDSNRAGAPIQFEFRMRPAAGGDYRWFLARALAVRGPTGEVVEWYGTSTDIDDLKRAGDELRESRTMLRLVLDNIPQGVFWKDRESRFLGCNRVVAQSMGLAEPADIAGRSHSDLASITPEQAGQFVRKDREVMESDVALRHISETMTLADGRTIWLETNKVPIHDKAGRVIGILGTWEDVTERNRVDEEIRKSLRSLRDAQRIAGLGSWEWDPATDVPTWSGEMFHIFGLDPTVPALNYHEVRRIYTPESWERLSASVERAIEDGTPYELSCEIVRPDGGRRWVVCRGEAVRDGGSIAGLRGTVQDVTELKRVERELAETGGRLRALMDALPVGVSFSDDVTCQRITGNPAVLTQFAVTSVDNLSASAPDPDAPGRQVEFYMDGRRIADSELPLQRAVAENRWIPPAELEVRLPDGRTWFTEASGAPIHDGHGNVIAGVAVTVDVTNRKRTEAALHENELRLHDADRRLADLVKGMSEACFTLDRDWRFTFVNDCAEPLLRHRRERMLGRSIWEVFDKLVGTPMELHYRRAMAERVPVSFVAFSRPSRSAGWTSASFRPGTGWPRSCSIFRTASGPRRRGARASPGSAARSTTRTWRWC